VTLLTAMTLKEFKGRAEVESRGVTKVGNRAFGLVLNVDGYPAGRAQKPCQGRFARLKQLR
jgi:hypothetical protein